MARGGFPRGMGGMGGGNMQGMLRQAQKMQEEMLKAQEELGEKTVEASVGGGVVTVIANGKKELVSVTIKPEAVDPDDVEMLQDLIVSAVNEAMRKADDMAASSMSRITGGMNIPGLF
ncbi:MAG: YbaB/EbfC family nucleoid-associated protein [Clostridia bacterium]|nr:YbaB/EbfC family nucleoid-associated protein [Clostridia bacterium]